MSKKAKGVMISMTDDFKEKAKRLAFKATGETNLSGFIRKLIEDYEKQNQ